MQCKLGENFARPHKAFLIHSAQKDEVNAIRCREGIEGVWLTGPGRVTNDSFIPGDVMLLLVPDDAEASRLHAALIAA